MLIKAHMIYITHWVTYFRLWLWVSLLHKSLVSVYEAVSRKLSRLPVCQSLGVLFLQPQVCTDLDRSLSPGVGARGPELPELLVARFSSEAKFLIFKMFPLDHILRTVLDSNVYKTFPCLIPIESYCIRDTDHNQ